MAHLKHLTLLSTFSFFFPDVNLFVKTVIIPQKIQHLVFQSYCTDVFDDALPLRYYKSHFLFDILFAINGSPQNSQKRKRPITSFPCALSWSLMEFAEDSAKICSSLAWNKVRWNASFPRNCWRSTAHIPLPDKSLSRTMWWVMWGWGWGTGTVIMLKLLYKAVCKVFKQSTCVQM